jgi:hypothetical protein
MSTGLSGRTRSQRASGGSTGVAHRDPTDAVRSAELGLVGDPVTGAQSALRYLLEEVLDQHRVQGAPSHRGNDHNQYDKRDKGVEAEAPAPLTSPGRVL